MTKQAPDVVQSAQPSTEPAAQSVDTSANNQPVTNPNPVAPDNKAPAEQPKPQQPTNLLQKAADEIKKEQEVFGEDWREKLANGDEKILKELGKHKTPAEVIKAYRELQKEYSRTRPVPELAKDATPEQVKEYREKVGIPDSWEKYDTNLDNGVVIGENHKEIVDKYLQKAHEMNLRPEVVKQSLQAYFDINNTMEAQAIQAAENKQKEVEQGLQKEWGSQYRNNINLISNHLENALGKEAFQSLNEARLADGSFLINDPKILNHFLSIAKEKMGGNTITPTSANDYVSLAERKAQLEKIASQDPKAWFNQHELRKELADIAATLANKK